MSIVLGLITVLLAARTPAKMAAKVSPLEAVTGNTQQESSFRHAANTRRWHVEVALGIHHAKAKRRSYILMTGAFAICITLFLGFCTLVPFMENAFMPKEWSPELSIVSDTNTCSIPADRRDAVVQNSAVSRVFGRMFAYDVPAQISGAIHNSNLISYEENQFRWAQDQLIAGSIDAQRFPFDQFKHHKGSNVTWSLEHIHAQQSEGMKTQDVWKKWLELHIPSVESIGGEHSELIDEMQGAINADKLERTVFESIQQKVLGLLSVSGNTEYMHSIANLALLNTADNAALNNSTFDVKRNDIIQMDKKGQYIPFCTKMVFLKYYTPSAENQLHFWGQADRIAYIKAINDVLSDYIEPIVLEKEETK